MDSMACGIKDEHTGKNTKNYGARTGERLKRLGQQVIKGQYDPAHKQLTKTEQLHTSKQQDRELEVVGKLNNEHLIFI